MIKPRRLRAGDTVSLVSVSSPVPTTASIDNMVRCLAGFGLATKVDPHAVDSYGYLAGADAIRQSALNSALVDPDTAAVFFAWGGKGATHLLEGIDYEAFRRRPKVVVGLSDPSAIVNALCRIAGVVTFHGPTGVNFAEEAGLHEYTSNSFVGSLFEADYHGIVSAYSEWETLRPGFAEGTLVRGHLSTIQTLLGSRFEPDWDGAIFFWEEVGRAARAIDLSLWHYRLAGVFDRIAGMIVGRPLECNDPEFDSELGLTDTIRQACSGYDFPILYNVDLGHADPKLTLPLGVRARVELQTTASGFEILEGGVE